MSEAEFDEIENETRFSGQKFLIGWAKIITSASFVAWVVFTWLGYGILISGKETVTVVEIIVAGGWVFVTAVFILGTRGVNKMLSNSKADINVGVGTK